MSDFKLTFSTFRLVLTARPNQRKLSEFYLEKSEKKLNSGESKNTPHLSDSHLHHSEVAVVKTVDPEQNNLLYCDHRLSVTPPFISKYGPFRLSPQTNR